MKITKVVVGDEPVSLVEAKAYLRVFHSEEDAVITAMIKNARQMLEMATGLSLVEREITLDAVIHGKLTLPYGPVTDITTIEIDGIDVAGDVVLDTITGTGVLHVEYTAGGYECEMAMKELLAFNYANRGVGTMPQSVDIWIKNNTRNLWLQ